jgi:hypothetical protein
MRLSAATIVIGLALVLAAPSAAQESPVSVEAAYAAELTRVVDETCFAQRESFDAIETSALAHGWVDASRTSDRNMQTILTATAKLAAQMESLGAQLVYSVYSRTIAKDEHFLVASLLTAPTNTGVGCSFYNFHATAPVHYASAQSGFMLGEPETRSEGGATIYQWRLADPEGRLMWGYLPGGTEASMQMGVAGLAVTVTSDVVQ